jgi:hypothetical protein
LLLAQHEYGVAQGTFQKLNLQTGTVTNLNYVTSDEEGGAWDVAFGSNNIALATVDDKVTGLRKRVRQIDLATNVVATRSDVPGTNGGPGIGPRAQIHRSADRTRMYFLPAADSLGPRFSYSATTNSFGPMVYTNASLDLASAAVNRNGALVVTRLPSGTGSASLEITPNFGFVSSFAGAARARDLRVHADEPARAVEERPARVAGVDRRVRLDHVVDPAPGERRDAAAERAHCDGEVLVIRRLTQIGSSADSRRFTQIESSADSRRFTQIESSADSRRFTQIASSAN